MRMQGVTQLLLSRTSCTAALTMGDSGTSTVLTSYVSMRLRFLRQSERTAARDPVRRKDELIRVTGRSIRNISKDGRAYGVRRA